VTALPLTVFVLISWQHWRKHQMRKVQREKELENAPREGGGKDWSIIRNWSQQEAEEQRRLTLLGMVGSAVP
jgi:hypothetical protein